MPGGVQGPTADERTERLTDLTVETPGVVTNPNRGSVIERLTRMERSSEGFLPSRLTLELAQSGFPDHQLDRAARLMARQFDLNPEWFFKPFVGNAYGVSYGGAGQLSALTDPVTGGPITLDTARRYLRPGESDIIRKMLQTSIRSSGTPTTFVTGGATGAKTGRISEAMETVDPNRVAQTIRAFGPINGRSVDFSQALAAAISVARDPSIDLGQFAENVRVAATAPSLPPMLQIAAAQRASRNGVTMRNYADIAVAVLPSELGTTVRLGEDLTDIEAAAEQRNAVLAKRAGGDETSAASDAAEADSLALAESLGGTAPISAKNLALLRAQAEFGQGITKAAGVPGVDFMKSLLDQSDDYNAAAEEIAQNAKVPFTDSWVGRNIGKGLSLAARPLDAVWRGTWYIADRLVPYDTDPVSYVARDNADDGFNDALHDVYDIWHGRTTSAEELAKQGVPPWATAFGQLAAGFWADPFQVGLNYMSSLRAQHTIFGLAEAGKASQWSSRAIAWVDGPVAHIGGLRGVSIPQYLVREMDRVKNAEAFFGRAVDNFRTYFTADGIDSLTAGAMYRFNIAAKKAGLTVAQREEGVRGVLLGALGVRTEQLGDLAQEIEALSRVRTAQATTSIADEATQLAIPLDTPGATAEAAAAAGMTQDARQAYGVLTDVEMDLLTNGPRMTEIPHNRTILGRGLGSLRGADGEVASVLRSIGQMTPERVGIEHIILIEKPQEAVRDFERSLTLAQVHDEQTIATAKLELSGALNPNNPIREQATASIVAKYNRLTIDKINARYGIDTELSDQIIENMTNRMSKAARERMIFSAAIDNPLAQTVALNKTRLAAIEKSLTGELDDAAKAALTDEQRKLVAFNKRSEKLNQTVVGDEPILASQLRNDYAMLDPTLYRAGIAETIGTVKKWERAFRGHFTELAPAKAVHIPLRRATDRMLDLAIRDIFLTVWKPLAVLRPAYVLRVVGLEEQGRFLATAGIARRATAGKWGGNLFDTLGLAKTRDVPIGFRMAEQAGTRANEVEDALLFLTDPVLTLERGLRGADRALGDTLADVVRSGGALTREMRERAVVLLDKYRGELAGIGIDAKKLTVKGNARQAAEAARATQARIDQGIERFRAPGLRPNEPLANNNASRLILASDDAATSMLKRMDVFKGSWVALKRGEPKFVESWHHVLSAQFGRDPLGRRYLDDIVKGRTLDQSVSRQLEWLQGKEGSRYAARLMEGPFDPEALEIQVRRGVTYARDLTHDGELVTVAAAARDNVLSIEALKQLDTGLQPLIVHGPDVTNTVLAKAGFFGKARDAMGKLFLQMPTNALSRQPYFKSWYDRMYRSLLETARAQGRLTPTTLRKVEADRALTANDDVARALERDLPSSSADNENRMFFSDADPLAAELYGPDTVYRAMSVDEYDEALQQGFFQSRGVQKARRGDTYFASGISGAAGYANKSYGSAFGRLPGFGSTEERIIVAFRKPEGLQDNLWRGPSTSQAVPLDYMQGAYRVNVGELDDAGLIAYQRREYDLGADVADQDVLAEAGKLRLEVELESRGPAREAFEDFDGTVNEFLNAQPRAALEDIARREGRYYGANYRVEPITSVRTTTEVPANIDAAELVAGFRETSRQFALGQVDRIMFNFSRSARLDDLTRNFFVFVQPFLEFPTVWSRIIRQNPAMVGHAIRMGRAGLDSGFLQRDPDTGELTIPLSWWAGAAPLLAMVTGGRMDDKGPGGGWSLSAPLTAFNLFANSTFQIPTGKDLLGDVPLPLPSLNPPFQALMQQFLSHNDSLDAGVKARLSSYLFQFGSLNVGGMIPAYLRHAIEGVYPNLMEDTTNFNATHFLQLQQAMGLTPDPDLARTQSAQFAGLRALFSAIFPASPKIEFPTQDLEDAYRALTAPIEEAGLGYQAGKEEFLRLHPKLTLLTIARSAWQGEDPDDPMRSPVAIPANQAVQQLLNTRGAQTFARDHPQWVWAIIPHELADGDFDPGAFFAQIASGQRKVLTPGEFLAEADEQLGWDHYFAENESWIARQEVLASENLGPGDQAYEIAKSDHDAEVAKIVAEHPAWSTAYDTFNRENVDPKVMSEARLLAKDALFTKTDVGQALVAYLKLRDGVKHDLRDSNLTSLDSVTAQRYGITSRYEEGLAAIIAEHPDFETAYRLFFSGDLRTGVKTYGDNLRDALPEGVLPKIEAWESAYQDLRDAPDMAGTEEERNAAYAALRVYVNQSYTSFEKGQNPMVLRWESYRPDQRQSYLVSLVGRSYGFFSRFDKETILGETTDPVTEAVWSSYDTLRSQIAQEEATNPNFSSTAAYKALDAWVLQNAQANPAFAQQVQHANTWGYAWEKALGLTDRGGRPVLFDTSSSGDAWAAFLDATRQIQGVVDQLGLHGDSSFDPRERLVYATLRTRLADYAAMLGEQNLAFAEQWKWLEKENGPDTAISTFVPDTYFRLGGIPGEAA